MAKSVLHIAQILEWADNFFKSVRRWPDRNSGRIVGADGTWSAIDSALKEGNRGLSGGSSLARLLSEYRGKYYRAKGPDLTIQQILKWADSHFRKAETWPTKQSGAIAGAGQETWKAVSSALREGGRGLPGGSSLARLLAEHRGRRNPAALHRLTIKQILGWADAHHRRTGDWSLLRAGRIVEAPSETWIGVENALKQGGRGLPGGSSLAKLLDETGRKRNPMALPKFTEKQILAWADMHQASTGQWPRNRSGPVADVQDTWGAIDRALRSGGRGLPGGSSLAELLRQRRGVRNLGNLPRLSIKLILVWANVHRQRTGDWPTVQSGPVITAEMEKWSHIDQALLHGHRGLPGGSSLAKLLAKHRGKRNRRALPPFSESQILEWADAHHARTRHWPNSDSGPIDDTGETWKAVQQALSLGNRGLPGGSSLFQLLKKRRGAIHPRTRPRLHLKTILQWADSHHIRTGKWPQKKSGAILDAPGDTWAAVDIALRRCKRGVKVKTSLAQLLYRHRGVPGRGSVPK